MKQFLCLLIVTGLAVPSLSFAADAAAAAKKQMVCAETSEFKGAFIVGEGRENNTFTASWFKIDAGKSILCVTESVNDVEKVLFKNTYLTAAKVKFTAGNCNYDNAPDRLVLAEFVDEGSPVSQAFKAWRFDVKTKRLKYEDAGKVECTN